MKDSTFELVISLMGIISGGMAVGMARASTQPQEAILHSAEALARSEILDAGLLFFLGAALLSAAILYLRRPHKSAA